MILVSRQNSTGQPEPVIKLDGLSNITPVFGEDNFFLKIQFGIRSTITKLFMHVSSRNMFPTTRNQQIRVHVYRPRHCCGD